MERGEGKEKEASAHAPSGVRWGAGEKALCGQGARPAALTTGEVWVGREGRGCVYSTADLCCCMAEINTAL